MPSQPTMAKVKVRLQKTLTKGLRRCTYRRWEASIRQAILSTQIKELERLYRGSPPYPVASQRIRSKAYPSVAQAKAALQVRVRRLLALGYRQI
jgi:hypothetical protein